MSGSIMSYNNILNNVHINLRENIKNPVGVAPDKKNVLSRIVSYIARAIRGSLGRESADKILEKKFTVSLNNALEKWQGTGSPSRLAAIFQHEDKHYVALASFDHGGPGEIALINCDDVCEAQGITNKFIKASGSREDISTTLGISGITLEHITQKQFFDGIGSLSAQSAYKIDVPDPVNEYLNNLEKLLENGVGLSETERTYALYAAKDILNEDTDINECKVQKHIINILKNKLRGDKETAKALAAASGLSLAEKRVVSLEGGGSKGQSYVPYFDIIREFFPEIEVVSGSSAGAILGSLFACNVTPGRYATNKAVIGCEDIWSNKYASRFPDIHLASGKGLAKGMGTIYVLENEMMASVKTWLDEAWPNEDYPDDIKPLAEKVNIFYEGKEPRTDNNMLTFNDFHIMHRYNPIQFKEFRATAYDLINRVLKVFCYENSPYLPVLTAVRASMAFPLVFQAVMIDGIAYSDGGIGSNSSLKAVRDYSPEEKVALAFKRTTGTGEAELYNNLHGNLHNEKIPGNLVTDYLIGSHYPQLDQSDKIEQYNLGGNVIPVEHGDLGTFELKSPSQKKQDYLTFIANLHGLNWMFQHVDEIKPRAVNEEPGQFPVSSEDADNDVDLTSTQNAELQNEMPLSETPVVQSSAEDILSADIFNFASINTGINNLNGMLSASQGIENDSYSLGRPDSLLTNESDNDGSVTSNNAHDNSSVGLFDSLTENESVSDGSGTPNGLPYGVDDNSSVDMFNSRKVSVTVNDLNGTQGVSQNKFEAVLKNTDASTGTRFVETEGETISGAEKQDSNSDSVKQQLLEQFRNNMRTQNILNAINTDLWADKNAINAASKFSQTSGVANLQDEEKSEIARKVKAAIEEDKIDGGQLRRSNWSKYLDWIEKNYEDVQVADLNSSLRQTMKTIKLQ